MSSGPDLTRQLFPFTQDKFKLQQSSWEKTHVIYIYIIKSKDLDQGHPTSAQVRPKSIRFSIAATTFPTLWRPFTSPVVNPHNQPYQIGLQLKSETASSASKKRQSLCLWFPILTISKFYHSLEQPQPFQDPSELPTHRTPACRRALSKRLWSASTWQQLRPPWRPVLEAFNKNTEKPMAKLWHNMEINRATWRLE